MWNKRLSHRIVPIDVVDDRIVGIQMQISSTEHMFIFQVYLPCVNHSYEVFAEYVNKLYDFTVKKGLLFSLVISMPVL